MTNNTKLITCDACMGWGVVDTGCDVEGTVMCHHCGGAGTIEVDALEDFKSFVGASLAVAGLRNIASDETSIDATNAESIFQTATILNASITADDSIVAIQATVESLAATEKARKDAAICTLDVLSAHSTPIEEMRKFGDVANRAQAAIDFLNDAASKLV